MDIWQASHSSLLVVFFESTHIVFMSLIQFLIIMQCSFKLQVKSFQQICCIGYL